MTPALANRQVTVAQVQESGTNFPSAAANHTSSGKIQNPTDR